MYMNIMNGMDGSRLAQLLTSTAIPSIIYMTLLQLVLYIAYAIYHAGILHMCYEHVDDVTHIQ